MAQREVRESLAFPWGSEFISDDRAIYVLRHWQKQSKSLTLIEAFNRSSMGRVKKGGHKRHSINQSCPKGHKDCACTQGSLAAEKWHQKPHTVEKQISMEWSRQVTEQTDKYTTADINIWICYNISLLSSFKIVTEKESVVHTHKKKLSNRNCLFRD